MTRRIVRVDEISGDKRDASVVRRITVPFTPAELGILGRAADEAGTNFKHLVRCLVITGLLQHFSEIANPLQHILTDETDDTIHESLLLPEVADGNQDLDG